MRVQCKSLVNIAFTLLPYAGIKAYQGLIHYSVEISIQNAWLLSLRPIAVTDLRTVSTVKTDRASSRCGEREVHTEVEGESGVSDALTGITVSRGTESCDLHTVRSRFRQFCEELVCVLIHCGCFSRVPCKWHDNLDRKNPVKLKKMTCLKNISRVPKIHLLHYNWFALSSYYKLLTALAYFWVIGCFTMLCCTETIEPGTQKTTSTSLMGHFKALTPLPRSSHK